MNNFDAYLQKCLRSVNVFESNDSIIPNDQDFNGNTAHDVADKLFEELNEHFEGEIKKVHVPSTISNDLNAFIWTNDVLKISYQITVSRSRVDDDYKITLTNLNEKDDVIDIAEDQVETQINDVISKMNDIKNNAKGPEPTSTENTSELPSTSNLAKATEPQDAAPISNQAPTGSAGSGGFSQGLQG